MCKISNEVKDKNYIQSGVNGSRVLQGDSLWVRQLFSTVVRDVSVPCVNLMDPSSTVHEPASSLSVTQPMASDE